MPTIYLLSITAYLDDVLPGYAVGKLGLKEIAFRSRVVAGDSRRDLAAMPFELTDKTLTVMDFDEPITFYIHPRELVA